MLRPTLIGALAFLSQATIAALSSSPSIANDRITAAIIVRELKALGYSSDVDIDDSGDPRVNMTIDGFRWSIYFYDCDEGPRDDRRCVSYQFYSGYTLQGPVSQDIINKWNTQQRYAKAYTYVQRNGSHSARIEIDVRSAGTDASPARTFHAYFRVMKDKAIQFRRTVGIQEREPRSASKNAPAGPAIEPIDARPDNRDDDRQEGRRSFDDGVRHPRDERSP